MTLDQFKADLATLQAKFEADKKILMKKYSLANNPYNLGDIIADQFSIIKVEQFGFFLSEDRPCMRYHGTELTKKNLKPKSNGNKEWIRQYNVVKKY